MLLRDQRRFVLDMEALPLNHLTTTTPPTRVKGEELFNIPWCRRHAGYVERDRSIPTAWIRV